MTTQLKLKLKKKTTKQTIKQINSFAMFIGKLKERITVCNKFLIVDSCNKYIKGKKELSYQAESATIATSPN